MRMTFPILAPSSLRFFLSLSRDESNDIFERVTLGARMHVAITSPFLDVFYFHSEEGIKSVIVIIVSIKFDSELHGSVKISKQVIILRGSPHTNTLTMHVLFYRLQVDYVPRPGWGTRATTLRLVGKLCHDDH